MKKIILVLMAVAVGAFVRAQGDAVKQYIENYKEVAINEMIRSGVPAAITLAQGILESKAGLSDLCQQSNNHFGIKCKDEWTGPYVLHDDDQKDECFRVYANAAESYKDHSDFLKNRPYYTDLFSLAPDDYVAWAKGLKKDGYATERDYPQMLIKLIEDNNLQQYTQVAMARMKNPDNATYASTNNATPAAQPAVAVAQEQKNNRAIAAKEPAGDEDKNVGSPAPQPAVNTATQNDDAVDETGGYPDGVFTINSTKVVYAKAGTSLFAVASAYNVSYKTLLDFNEIKKGDILQKGRLIYLERKPKTSIKDIHIATADETIEDIAQKEGVRLESLLQYNSVQRGNQLAAGTKIRLRVAPGTSSRQRRA